MWIPREYMWKKLTKLINNDPVIALIIGGLVIVNIIVLIILNYIFKNKETK